MPVPSKWSDLSQTAANNSPPGSETVGPLANDYFQAAFAFIRQLYDQGGLPNVPLNANGQRITNVAAGTASTDAVNLNQVTYMLGAPQGTRLVFQQAAAPAGWALDTSSYLSDCSVRFNNTGLSNGGTTPWSAWNYGGQFGVNAHQLTPAEMPSHTHGDYGHGHGLSDPGHNHGVNDPGHSHSISRGAASAANIGANWTDPSYNGGYSIQTNGSGTGIYLNASGTGIGIATGYANLAAAGSDNAHGHTYNTPQVKFCDVVVCIKQ